MVLTTTILTSELTPAVGHLSDQVILLQSTIKQRDLSIDDLETELKICKRQLGEAEVDKLTVEKLDVIYRGSSNLFVNCIICLLICL